MEKKIKTGIYTIAIAFFCIGIQSFAYTDCYQEFNEEINAAQDEYETDAKKCRFAWPPGMCMPEAELSYDKAIDEAVENFKNCI